MLRCIAGNMKLRLYRTSRKLHIRKYKAEIHKKYLAPFFAITMKVQAGRYIPSAKQ